MADREIISPQEMRLRYQQGLLLLPVHMREGITAYLESGRRVGGFMTGLLELGPDTDFVWMHADQINKSHVAEWKRFFLEFMPRDAHGSRLKVAAWREMGGLKGMGA